MSTIQRGIEAETEVLRTFVRAGLRVFLPWGDGGPYDLVVEAHDTLWRVQVKAGRLGDGVVVFNAHGTDHGRGQRDYRGRADLLAVHCDTLGRVFVVPVETACRTKASIRLTPARNNQVRGVRRAEDCTVERWLATLGRPAGG